MKDYIVRATAANNQIRAFAATTRDVVETARQAHNTSPVATAALGRLLTGGAMMGTMMKNEKDLLTIQIKCEGPIKGLTVTADVNGNVKGYVENPDVMLPPNAQGKLDVGGSLDLGVLSVIKDIGLKEPYVGQTQLVTGEIAEDLTYYFATSEQVPSSVALGVLMNKDNTVRQQAALSSSFFRVLPMRSSTRSRRSFPEFASITALLNAGKTPEEILPQLNGYGGKVVTIDARRISEAALGKYFPNSPMLAAVVAVTGVMDKETFLHEMRLSYQHKFAKKPEVIDGNMKALELTFESLGM